MDVRAAAADYVARMVQAVTGIKALLLDDETARIVGVVTSQTDLFRRDVFLTERLGTLRKRPLHHLSAIVFVRPSAENIRALRKELHDPIFGSYYVVFSNVVRPTYVEEIADADEMHVITQVHEYFADFYALNTHLFTFNVPACLDARLAAGAYAINPYFERTVDGILATLLALKRRPVVRFQGSSSRCRNLAQRVSVRMDQETALFDFRSQHPAPLLLLLDRCEDPVTPLLNQWTYEAMVHELVSMQNNCVSLEDAPNVPDDLKHIVMDSSVDDFYRRNRYENFGELGINLKKLVDAFHSEAQGQSGLMSIDDMMRFVSSYPEFRKTMSNVSKHVALSSELSRLVEKHSLLQVSQLEQDIACREAESDHRRQVNECLADSKITPSDKLRLVMLFSLRYEQSPSIRKTLEVMLDALRKANVGLDGVHLVSDLKRYAGASQRSGDVFSNRSFFAIASNTVRRGIGGVENVYTQHEPLLVSTLDDMLRGRLKTASFPCVGVENGFVSDSLLGEYLDGRGSSVSGMNGSGNVGAGSSSSSPFVPAPRDVIVFIAGGVTLEESKCVSGINGGPNSFKPPEGSTTASAAAAARQLGARIILGGSAISNSSSFAVEITRSIASQNAARASREERRY
jgi:vacuolar protein sorting-associated protein 45